MPVVADIVKITAPSSAEAGKQVIIDVSVKNLGLAPAGYNDIAITGVFDSTSLSWQFDYLNVAPQETVIFRGWFTMPSKKVTVKAYSWYWDGSKWVLDDSVSIDIALTTLEPEFSGFSISDYSKV